MASKIITERLVQPQRFVSRVESSALLLKGVAFSLFQATRLASKSAVRVAPRRVAHISPSYFSDHSLIGGGERYATCLAEAMAKKIDTTLVSFGPKRDSFRLNDLKVEVYPALKLLNGSAYDPLCYSFLREIAGADVIHCHQYRTAVTNLAMLMGRAQRKHVFVTDLGGAGVHFTERLSLANCVDGFLPISAFGAEMTPPGHPQSIIYGGVDPSFLERTSEPPQEAKALFVGRYLPHKGINYLIEGMDKDIRLDVIGRPYSEPYFELLKTLAVGKRVRFITDATDEQLTSAYRQASVTILPSVYDDVYGTHYAMPELLGLVLLESMACGTPVICTDVTSMPEFVEDGVTGFVVPPNDPQALGERVRYLVENPDVAREMGQRGRDRVLERYTWDAVAERCLDAYRGGSN